MKGYKGFDKDLNCRGKQYEIGKTYKEKEAQLCNKGFHFVEYPLDAFSYYPPADGRYAEIEAEDVTEEKDNDSKRVSKKINIKAEISISKLIEAAVEIVISPLIKKATTGDEAHSATTGDEAHSATAGARAHSATAGARAHSEVKGANSIAVSLGINGQASGTLDCWIVLAEWKEGKDGRWKIKTVKSIKVDGYKIKPDTFYTLVDGKFIEGE
ncbi:MAG: hypothetical protein LBH43_15600 [Treponema sp.]|nr:hypothetical protein [Treponema sp.]